jgi:signal transduction histidine kinase
MQHHRGTVSAESAPGKGAAFMLRLPVSQGVQG